MAQIEKSKGGGSIWLEPMKEFIDCALQAQKIARKEYTNGKICDFAKRVGSTYLLDRGKIRVEYKKPFVSLRAAALARATAAPAGRTSIIVDDAGVEPATSAMSMQRSNQLS